MKIKEIENLLKPNTQITKREYEKLVYQLNPECSQDTIYWQLRRLQQRGVIKKTGRGIHTVKRICKSFNCKKCFFIEVERMLEEPIFNMLSESYLRVLLCPAQETFYTYFQENMIVVQRLLTEAPKPIQQTKSCCLEKILVDLFSNKLTGQLIQGAEYPMVFEETFRKFYIDEKKMMRYARRRNLEVKIKKFIEEETDIKLYMEDGDVK